MLCLLALVAALVLWAVTSRGGGGGHGSSAPTSSHTPAATITPGPTPSGPHNGGEPGGRDTAPSDSSGATNGGSGNGGTGGGSSSGDDTGGAGSGGGSTAGSDTAGSGGGSAGGGTGGAPAPGQQVPVGSTLATCAPGAVSLSLSSVHNSYQPGQDPEFRLVAANSSAVSCKIDVGPKSAVFTVTGAPGGSHVWASDDCPTTGSHLLQVPARSSMSYTLRWNGRNSSPQCAKPKGEQSAPGTYLVQLRKSGYGTQQASFQLSDD